MSSRAGTLQQTREITMASTQSRPLAVVTGASSGIGFELARQFAEHGYDLIVAAQRGLKSGPCSISRRIDGKADRALMV